MSPSANLRFTAYAALFTAFIIISGYLSIPISPIPIVLTDFFVMLTGLLLGYQWGLASVSLYLFLGALGLPVFAGGKAGLAVLSGPTGGFLAGYLATVFIIGILADRDKASLPRNFIALVAGNIALYACGVSWLKVQMNLTWQAALAAGLLPFISGTLIKIGAALSLARALLPQIYK